MNGKSFFFNLLKMVFGDLMDTISKSVVVKNTSNNKSHLNTELEALENIRIGYLSELKKEDQLEEETIKAITGGDTLNFRGLQQTNRALKPSSNIFILTNNMPKINVDQSVLDRLIVIPFNNRFVKDSTFEEKMKEKKDLIFSYIMKYGTVRDKFDTPEEMNQARAEYIDENKTVFIDDFIKYNCVTMERQ